MRTVMPLDLDRVEESARRTRHLVVATEAYRHGGVGGEIAAAMQESLFGHLDAPVLRVGARYAPVPPSPVLLDPPPPGAPDPATAPPEAPKAPRPPPHAPPPSP